METKPGDILLETVWWGLSPGDILLETVWWGHFAGDILPGTFCCRDILLRGHFAGDILPGTFCCGDILPNYLKDHQNRWWKILNGKATCCWFCRQLLKKHWLYQRNRTSMSGHSERISPIRRNVSRLGLAFFSVLRRILKGTHCVLW